MKTIYSFILLFATLFLASCESQEFPDSIDTQVPDGTPIEIITGLSFPEMQFGAGTRSMNEGPTAEELLNVLKVNLFVFDSSGVMLQFIGPEDISIQNIDRDTQHVYFKVKNIYTSSQPRRLHFVVTAAEDLHKVTGGEYIKAMANEHTTMPALVADSPIDAYWGIKELDRITENLDLNVKLIRNFLKITVSSLTAESNFKLLGYTVVNRPGKGTIAPYIHKEHLFASFLNNETNALVSYDDITEQGYFGVNPAGSDASMICTSESEVAAQLKDSEDRIKAGAADTPCYIYERSQSGVTTAGSDVKVTYIILKGLYNGKEFYYKIDIGRDILGKFEYYDLLRNFQYNVRITEVGGEGSPTLREAMNGAPNNNLSANTVTRDLFAIGYEGERIEVSTTDAIITEHTENYALRFKYTPGSIDTFDPSKLKIYDIDNEETEFDVSGVTTTTSKSINLEGDAIEEATISLDSDGWYTLTVHCKNIPLDARRLEQSIRIYYKGGSAGLGRTVKFMLRKPWEFTKVSATKPGTAIGDSIAVNLTIPSGMSKSQFPLILTFESDKQNIYGKSGTKLTVATAKSGFAGATTDQIICYEWRMEWEDYAGMSTDGGGNITANFGMNTTAAEDKSYSTTKIDAAAIFGRNDNNNTNNFCIKISHKGSKYINPYYVNVLR